MGFHLFKKKNKKNTPNVIPEKTKMLTKEEILRRILGGEFSSFIELKSETKNNTIYIPELEMSITPSVLEVSERIVSLNFEIYSDTLKTYFHERSTGLGKDTETAYGMAIGTFAFSFMQGLKAVADNDVKYRINSEYAGHSHSWSVYCSNIAGTNSGEKSQDISDYWELLKDDIVKRLGNQKAVYVKIINSTFESNVIGECTINDIMIPELRAKLFEISSKWKSSGYKIEKQYFFIVQDDDTIIDSPYTGKKGQAELCLNVAEYMKNFNKISSREEYDNIIETTAAVTGDRLLAEECFYFIPQICAERHFENIFICNDELRFTFPDNNTVTSYKCQISDYTRIMDAVYDILNSGLFGEDTKLVSAKFAGANPLYDEYEKMKEKGLNPKGIKVNYICYNVPEDFNVR